MNVGRISRVRWIVAELATALFVAFLPGDASPRAQDSDARTAASPPVPAAAADDGKLRIIAFGAHPDDCEYRVGGVAAKWAALGHHVKLVSVTNGDIGHWEMAGGPLAQRRAAEARQCAEILGVQSEVLDNHDGELLPTLENRKTITRLIREWKADLVLSHRPNDYHPDHRNVGILVQDAAFMVTVPYYCPDVPFLRKNPVFLYYEDRFQKPTRFSADIVVAIDDVIDQKLACPAALESQAYEGGAGGGPESVPDPSQKERVAARKKEVHDRFERRFATTARQFAAQLAEWYGPEDAKTIQYAEAFEICEYGRMPSRDEIRQLFPFFPPD